MVTRTIAAYSSLNVAVATMNMSTAAMAVIWFRRKLRQVGEGPLGRSSVSIVEANGCTSSGHCSSLTQSGVPQRSQ
jgi:hypothetical protein